MTHAIAAMEALEGRAYLTAQLTPVLALTVPIAEYHDFATDSRGNLYTCGVYTDKTDFNPERRKTYRLPGASGWYVAKYRSDGALLWARGVPEELPSDSFATLQTIACDRYDNVILAGRIHGRVNVDTGRGVRQLSAPETDVNAFVWKLDPNGGYKAAAMIDVSGKGKPDDVLDVAVAADGSVLLAGYWVDGFSSYLVVHAVLTKLDARLNTIWINQLPGLNAQSVAVNQQGNVLVTVSGRDGTNILLLNRHGRFVWSRNLSGGADGSGAVFDPAGNAFVYGTFSSDFTVQRNAAGDREFVDMTATYNTGVVLKYGGDGTLAWQRQIVATSKSGLSGLVVDRAGFVHVAGAFAGDVDLDGGRGTVGGHVDPRSLDAFLATIDQSGRLLGGITFGEAERDESYEVLTTAPRGELLVHYFASEASSRTAPAGVRVFRVEE
jgi:hypothetical protein